MPEIPHAGSKAPCPDAVVIAAYVDGTLEREAREQVERHLAACDECYELTAEVLRTEEALAPASADVRAPGQSVSMPFRWRRIAVAGGLLAAAASVMIVVNQRRTPLDALVSAVGEQRLIAARPTGGFHYGPLRSPLRSAGGTEDANVGVLAETARLRNRATETGSPDDIHAWGVAQMIAGDARASASTLESLRRMSPGVSAYESDLGAAYLSLLLQTDEAGAAVQALEALDRAIGIEPELHEAWFNKALVLEHQGRTEEAVQCWNRYLELDGRSPWAAEAERHRARLLNSRSGR